MDSFRGSIPPNFISFRLEKQTTEVVNTPDSHPADASTFDPPVSMRPQSQSLNAPQSHAEDITSTHSVDSDPDVTTYAESMVHQLESRHTLSQVHDNVTPSETVHVVNLDVQEEFPVPTTVESQRASTPLAANEGTAPTTDLSAFESAFRVVVTSESQLAELVNVSEPHDDPRGHSPVHQDAEATSSVGDAPSLPGGECKVRYLTDPSGDEGVTDQSSLVIPVALYGRHPFTHTSETGTEDDTGSELLVPSTSKQSPGQDKTEGAPPSFGEKPSYLEGVLR